MVTRKPHEIASLRRAGRATAELQRRLTALARPGVTTRALDAAAAAYIGEIGGEAVFATQNGFPGCINTSVNDEAVHGIPGDRVLVEGDLLKIDCGLALGGFCGDATITLAIGDPAQLEPRRRHVLEAAREALRRGIRAARIGGYIGDIGHAMESYIEREGLHLLRQYTGHGLGRRLWEKPIVPSVGKPRTGQRIVEGLVITIEPIVVAGQPKVYVAPDGWTVRTHDGAPVAQFEHTIIVAPRGAEILTAA